MFRPRPFHSVIRRSPFLPSRPQVCRWAAFAIILLALQRVAAAGEPIELESGNREAVKRLNETLTRAGHPALMVEPLGPNVQVGVVLSEAAERLERAAPDHLRSPVAKESITDPALLTGERTAEVRGITEEQAEELHGERGLDYADLLTMPTDALRQALFEQEREAGDHPEEAMRWEESFKLDEFGKLNPAAIERARRQALALPLDTTLLPADVASAQKLGTPFTAQSVTPATWTWKGPGNIGGRIRTMVVHPTQTNRMWIGSVGGGIWYSSNGGTSWSPVNDFMSNLAVSTLAMDPTNPNLMYAGTGEGFYNADGIRGAGIYSSEDGGVTWNQLASTANTNFLYVQSIAVSPDGTTLLAATSTDIFGTNYIYRSADHGKTWTAALNATGRIGHVEFNPTDSTKAIASGYNHLALYSTNTGASWTSAATGPTGGTGYSNGSTSNGGRVEVRYARSNPTIVYAAYDFGSASYLYKSTDGGVNYATVNTTGTWLSTQGWYANAIWVSPVDPTYVVVGGLDIYRSTNSGASFTKISNWQNAPTSAHADHHGIVSDPGYNASSDNLVYFTNDGGIYKAANVSTVTTTKGWTVLNNQLGITQFYGAGVNVSTGTIVAGAQDNGTIRFTTGAGTNAWSTMYGGDGGYCASDQSNSAYYYGEYVYLDLNRSTNSGASASDISSGISDANSSTLSEFIAPFILDPNAQATLLAGGTQLWRTTNARASSITWASIKAADGTSHITAVAVAPGNSDVIWVGHLNGDVYMTTNGTATTPTWTKVDDNATALPARRVTRITVDPTNSSRVYVTFGGYSANNVWTTTTAGASWSNATGTLPAAPVYGLAISPTTPQTIYAGTDVGVFASDNGGTTWSTTNIGPTLASVQDVFVSGTNLVTVTHGRGVFTTPLSPTDTTPPALTITPADGSPTNASPVAFRLDWSEPVTGFTLAGVQVSGGTASTFSGSSSNYTLSVTPAGNPATITLSVPAGSAQDAAGNASTAASASVAYSAQSPFLYSTAFDGTAAPTGWSANGDWQWGVPTSGPNADHTGNGGQLYGTVLAGNYNDSASEYLTTPTFTLPSSGLPYRLRFWMWMNAESGFDGGNLEMSTNGGAFGVVPSSALSVPYNSSAVASMPGGLGWTGTTYATWTRVRMDLSAYAGGTAQFRYHFTSDGGVSAPGWYIDDFTLEQDPVVTLAASDPVAADGGDNGAFSVNLFPAAPGPLSIGYSVAGTAASGTDYTVLGGVASVAAGTQRSTLSVIPVNRNGARTSTQTVVLTLANGTDYTVGSPNTATVYIASEVGYDAWRAAHFTDAEFTNDLISGPNADPDGDGIVNLLEYALGLDPKTANAGGLPTPQIVTVNGQQYLSMTLAKPQSASDVTYSAEVSGDLLSWDGSAAAVSTAVQTNTPAGFDTLTFQDQTAMTAANGFRRFLRLRVTRH